MKTVLVSKCFLEIEQYVEFKMSVLISPSKSLISSHWITYDKMHTIYHPSIIAGAANLPSHITLEWYVVYNIKKLKHEPDLFLTTVQATILTIT